VKPLLFRKAAAILFFPCPCSHFRRVLCFRFDSANITVAVACASLRSHVSSSHFCSSQFDVSESCLKCHVARVMSQVSCLKCPSHVASVMSQESCRKCHVSNVRVMSQMSESCLNRQGPSGCQVPWFSADVTAFDLR
jgi:ribosomal protein L40E